MPLSRVKRGGAGRRRLPAASGLALVCLAAALARQTSAGAEDSPVRRDAVVVTGVYEPLPLEEADRPVTVLDAGQNLLSRSPVDLLREEPSVDVRARAPAGVQADVSLRGGAFGQTLILLDGMRLNHAQTGHHNMDLPAPASLVSQVEILRGSGSTLYGSDAVGGVVNFITRPPETSEMRFGSAAGSFGTNQQHASFALVRGRLAQQLAASRDFSSGFRPNRDYRNLSLASRTHLTSAAGSTAVLLGHSDRPFGAENFYGDYPSWERTRTWFAYVRQQLGEHTSAAVAVRRHSDLFLLVRGRPEEFANRHTVEGWQISLRRSEEFGPNSRLYFGAEALHDAITSTNLGAHSRNGGAVYAAADLRALGRFSLSAGVRGQAHRGWRSNLSPTAAGGLWLSRRLRLRASASRAFRLPSFTDLYYHDPASRGSPDLAPETAWSYDVGADGYLGRNIRAEVTFFHRRESNGIDYVRGSTSEIWRAANIQRLRFRGLEAALWSRAGARHSWQVRYSHLSGSRAALGNLISRYVFNYPSHAGRAAWQTLLPGQVTARATVGVVQRNQRRAYAVADLCLNRSAGRFRPFVEISNLSGSRYEEILGVPMPGRAILGGVEIVLSRRAK